MIKMNASWCRYSGLTRLRHYVSATLGIMFLLYSPAAHASKTNVFFFSSYDDLVLWKRHSSFTNGFEMECAKGLSNSLRPPLFITNLFEELRSSAFDAMIMQEHGHLLNPQPFAVAVCDGNDRMAVDIRANFPVDPKRSPEWVNRFRFYVASRFGGHSTNYIAAALQEESSGTNVTLPIGFPTVLKDKYRIPSKWIERNTSKLSRLDLGLPLEPGMVEPNDLWVVRDQKFAYVFYILDGIPFSQRRDPIEYEPRYSAQFDAAIKEASSATSHRALLDREVQQVLERKFGIMWVLPEELNY
jgi:hypothetical protein